MENSDDAAAAELVPLSRVTSKGTELYRPDGVEVEIAAALTRPLQELVGKKRTVSAQCLVYVIRHLRPNREVAWYSTVLLELLSRVDAVAAGQASGLPPQSRHDVRQTVREWFLETLFEGGEKADELEALFSRKISLKTIDEIRKLKRRSSLERNESAFGTEKMTAYDQIDAINFDASEKVMPRGEASVQLNSSLGLLSDKEKDAMIAVHAEGLKETSIYDDEMTVAKKMGRVGSIRKEVAKKWP